MVLEATDDSIYLPVHRQCRDSPLESAHGIMRSGQGAVNRKPSEDTAGDQTPVFQSLAVISGSNT
jgi:hypothetical protein